MSKSGRTPHGVRGLKSFSRRTIRRISLSHPARGAWIEIFQLFCTIVILKSHPARGAWIEIYKDYGLTLTVTKSHPARGAWIEIKSSIALSHVSPVAPRTGCVD